MLKILDAIKARRSNKEEGSAIIFAIILSLVVMAVLVLVTTSTLTTSTTSREASSREGMLTSAHAGLEAALYNANNGSVGWLESIKGIENSAMIETPATAGNIPGLKWRIYTEQVVTPGTTIAYYVYSTGFVDELGPDEGLTLRALFQGTSVSTGKYNTDGTVSYSLNPDGAFAYGILGLNSVEFAGNSKIYTADSNYGAVPLGGSTVGTKASSNFTVNVPNTTHGIKEVTSSRPGVNTGCSGGGCSSVDTTYREAEFMLDVVTQNVSSSCSASNYPVWKASENNGILNLISGTCVSGLIFDVNTTVPANFSAVSPLRLNLLGDVIINEGVTVNKTNTPTALNIRANGGNFSTPNSGSANMVYVSETASCTINGSFTFFGGLACNSVKMLGSSKTYIDLATKSSESITRRHIWDKSFVEEV